MNLFSWLRHSCLPGRDSDVPISWNEDELAFESNQNLLAADEYGLTQIRQGTIAFIRVHPCSSVAKFVFVKFHWVCRTAELDHSFSSFRPNMRGRDQDVRDSSRPTRGAAANVAERRDESRRCRQECLRHVILALGILSFLAASAWGQLPDGAGKAETQTLCTQCHELERSISLRQDRAGWQATMEKMSTLGMKATDQEMQAVLTYLSEHYPAETVPRINVNKARAIDLESGLSLLRSQARLIIEYREKNGDFKSIEDLKKVPGVDAAKIEARKDRLIFQ
jgi:competence protein ComEA